MLSKVSMRRGKSKKKVFLVGWELVLKGGDTIFFFFSRRVAFARASLGVF